MKRVSFFIDGFNLYHSVKQFAPDCRWLNLKALCKSFLKQDEELQDIYYFTAFASWNPTKVEKHKLYISALRTVGVKIVCGKFKEVRKHCNICQKDYKTHEEKRTDVNIAIKLFEDAVKDMYDMAVVVSGDSDLIPPIETIKENFPTKTVAVLVPVGRKTKELRDVSDIYKKLKTQDLKNARFPEELADEKGKIILTCPQNWKYMGNK